MASALLAALPLLVAGRYHPASYMAQGCWSVLSALLLQTVLTGRGPDGGLRVAEQAASRSQRGLDGRVAEKLMLVQEIERGVGLARATPPVLTTDSSSSWQIATRHTSANRAHETRPQTYRHTQHHVRWFSPRR